LHQDYYSRFWPKIAISKELSRIDYFMHYKHEEVVFAMNQLRQCSISFDVVDCRKVSLNLVQRNSINSIVKLVLGHFLQELRRMT
jgi:hypothetical protein